MTNVPSRTRYPSVADLGTAVVLLAAYIVVGKLGLRLAFEFPNATPVWPATGLALVAFLLLGYRVWPVIFAGAFLVNITTAGTVATSLGIATGNTLEGVVGAWLAIRFAGGRECLDRAERIFTFTLLVALLSTMVSATLGVASLHLAGLVPRDAIGSIWVTWWLGDASGDLLVAPVFLTWITTPLQPLPWRRWLETIALFGSLTLVGVALFGGLPQLDFGGGSLKFLCIPFLTWAAVRLGMREAATATLLLGAIAVWGMAHQNDSFGAPGTNASLLLLQVYMAVAAVMTLTLAAAVTERKAAETQLLALSIRDPLTGIANYRYLITNLEAEIERSERTGRPFALLLLDVDGLKQINDRHGHLTGSRALCRVAEVLRDSARVVDTAARYGGDEFALLLPETTAEEALNVGARVRAGLEADPERPAVRVSQGVAIHPRDGATPDALIEAADRKLYRGRALARREPLAPSNPAPHTS